MRRECNAYPAPTNQKASYPKIYQIKEKLMNSYVRTKFTTSKTNINTHLNMVTKYNLNSRTNRKINDENTKPTIYTKIT